jgi:hypothetical protein
MNHSSIRRPALAFVVGAVLMSSPALAVSPPWRFTEEVGRNLWAWVNKILPSSHGVTVKSGCSIDSDGQLVCKPVTSTPASKHGCTIDPSGTPRCNP